MTLSSVTESSSVLEGVKFGVGTWSWGDRLFWGYGNGYHKNDVEDAFRISLNSGITFFDTAESYGQGSSETMLGEFIRSAGQPIQVATKFLPFPWRLSRRSLNKALTQSLKRLGLSYVDLYQMHQPMPPIRIETWMDAMAEAVQSGLVKAVGVSNYDRSQTQQAYDALTRQGIPLASNQVEYHMLNRTIEKNGLLQYCSDLGIKVIAYSPLGSGMLTGKYSVEHPPSGFRSRKFSRGVLTRAQRLLDEMKKIGSNHGGKSASQVALNWVICKGAIPIPGAKNASQAEENAGALGWRLTENEVQRLDELSDFVLQEK